jgi:hypothetical protein
MSGAKSTTTRDELLSALSLVWHHCRPDGVEALLDDVETNIPDWRKKAAELAEDSRKNHSLMLAWDRARKALQNAGIL